MRNETAGSSGVARHRAGFLSLAVVTVPLVFGGCVAGQQSVAGFAPAESPAAPGAEGAAQAVSEAAGDGEAIAALAPIRRENGTISGSAAIDRMIANAADANNIPRDLAFGVVHVESTYNPRARGAGVYGLSQIMPATARSLGFSGSAEALYDPETNLRYGMRYLSGAWEKGGRDVCRAAMKYKGGHRATTMTRSASAYCGRVRQHMARIAGNPILADAPVQLAVNAPATAVAAAAPSPAREASHVASALSAAPVAPTRSASAAIEATREAAAAPALADAAVVPSDTSAQASLAAVPAEAEEVPNQAADASAVAFGGRVSAASRASVSAEPDPGRFGG